MVTVTKMAKKVLKKIIKNSKIINDNNNIYLSLFMRLTYGNSKKKFQKFQNIKIYKRSFRYIFFGQLKTRFSFFFDDFIFFL